MRISNGQLRIALFATAVTTLAEGQTARALEHGFLVTPIGSTAKDDLRLGRIASRLAERGHESFVATDCVRPPPDPERAIVHGRWRLDDARRARRARHWPLAVAASDEAISAIETNAFEHSHLALLVEALLERGATALAMDDPGTAETVFSRALALDPLIEPDPDLFGEILKPFSEVQRATREVRLGSVRVEVKEVPEALVSIDFGTPRTPPVDMRLPDGRHFVSISAPLRHEVVARVQVRAERETLLTLRPPSSGDAGARARALEEYKASDPLSLVSLANAAGLRFLVLAEASSSSLRLSLVDGETGTPSSTEALSLSADPGADELDAATVGLLRAAALFDPELSRAKTSTEHWYARWWVIGLLGLATTGAAVATYFAISSSRPTIYEFEP